MEKFLLVVDFVLSFGMGVWLAPVVRADYGDFKSFAATIKSDEAKIKANALKIINKL